MSASCIGTCSHCGAERFFLSNTLSLQLDDGRLKLLPHPREDSFCEREGLKLWQASERGRLYSENFYVCLNCGKDGETIEPVTAKDHEKPLLSVRGAMKWGWTSATILFSLILWRFEMWPIAISFGGPLLYLPVIAWREQRKYERAQESSGLPWPNAPGNERIAAPVAGSRDDSIFIVGQLRNGGMREPRATGPCCDDPNWRAAIGICDQDRVPCPACSRGVMVTSQHSIH